MAHCKLVNANPFYFILFFCNFRSEPVRRKIKKISPLKKRSASYSPKSAGTTATRLHKKFAGSSTDSDAEKKTKTRNKKKSVKEVIGGESHT